MQVRRVNRDSRETQTGAGKLLPPRKGNVAVHDANKARSCQIPYIDYTMRAVRKQACTTTHLDGFTHTCGGFTHFADVAGPDVPDDEPHLRRVGGPYAGRAVLHRHAERGDGSFVLSSLDTTRENLGLGWAGVRETRMEVSPRTYLLHVMLRPVFDSLALLLSKGGGRTSLSGNYNRVFICWY